MKSKFEFIEWHHRAGDADLSRVFPDGCRDVLVVRRPCGPEEIILTELDFQPRTVALSPGAEITGYRLRPGVTVSPRALEAVAENHDRAETILRDECGDCSDLDDAIAALAAPAATVSSVSSGLGVSIRTLQRFFLARNLPPPEFWRLLARARRAAGMLPSDAPLAEIADECGFSDQAHMTREFVRWFDLSPALLRRNVAVLDLLRQPALGNWTGEQISTR